MGSHRVTVTVMVRCRVTVTVRCRVSIRVRVSWLVDIQKEGQRPISFNCVESNCVESN